MPIQNDLLLRTAKGEETERPPVWIMRQAGRILPEYRALRAGFPDFKAFVKTPDAAAEATLQPLDALGVDAVIIFSDILVVPEAMGLDYLMVEKTGPRFPEVIRSRDQVDRLLAGAEAAEALQYVPEAIRMCKKALAGKAPLIGFAGAPWTILAYMVEGGGSKTFSAARALLYRDEPTAMALLEKITATTIAYLKMQIEAGADLIQLFDSWAGELPPAQYRKYAIPFLKQIAEAIPEVPKTIFAKGAWFAYEDLGELPFDVIGLDWQTPPAFARARAGAGKVLQGNLDPCVLYGDPGQIEAQTLDMLRVFGRNHIANLGHGVYPDTPLEGVRTFVNTVRAFRYVSGDFT